MEKERADNMVLFLDQIGRTLIGESIPSRCSDETLVVKNPIIIHFDTGPKGELKVSFFPIFFKDFLADQTEGTVWSFNKRNVTVSDKVVLDVILLTRYEHMINVLAMEKNKPQQSQPVSQPQQIAPSQNVVKLFDD